MKLLKIFLSAALSSCLLFTACVDADIDEALDYGDYYLSVDDADGAILGLYGKVMELAAPVVVLNELRGDLLDVTNNASLDLQQINLKQPDKNNQWTDVTKFYNVIQNCNDILYNFDKMKDENKLTTDEYNERYSDVAAIRCWVYFQLAVQFGNVPYLTEPAVDVSDLNNYKDKILGINELVPELIRTMESLPTLEPYRNSPLISGTVDDYRLEPYFITKKVLLGDLYLFANRFEDAVRIYREVLRVGEDQPATSTSQNRKNRLAVAESSWGGQAQIYYNTNKPLDESLTINGWKDMFSLPADNTNVSVEMLWEMTFDYKYAPQYPFIELFANKGKGKYFLKPSTYAVNAFWGSEVQNNGTPYDARGLTGGIEQTPEGDYLVSKYISNYDAVNKPLETTGKWFLYRAATLHLRYAEAANRAGYPRLAWALVNDGIRGAAFAWTRGSDPEYRGDSTRIASFGPGMPYPAPYDFDARYTSVPYLRAPYRNGGGIRGRANLPNVDLGTISHQDSIVQIEKLILREAGLELAYEGCRWTDLIRFANRYQNPAYSAGTGYANGSDFLNQILSGKYQTAGEQLPDYSSEQNWYLLFYDE
jgi:hypothetical protein